METLKTIIDNANHKIEVMYSSIEDIVTLDSTFEVIKGQINDGLTLAAENFFSEEEVREMKNSCINFSIDCYHSKKNEIIEAIRKNFVLL